MNYNYWINYFISNQNNFDHINWTNDDHLTADEQKLIMVSIQQFQKGENSEGKNLWRNAQLFVKDREDKSYLDAIKLFIKEEQRHALVLGKFMDIHRIPKIKEHWVDSAFRWLRKFQNLEISIIVLLTAELIADVYYRALHSATGSILLQSLCAQILKEEHIHLQFQAFTIYHFNTGRSPLLNRFVKGAHRVLLAGTIIVVWAYHRKVLIAGGYNLLKFAGETFWEFDKVYHLVNDVYTYSDYRIQKPLFTEVV